MSDTNFRPKKDGSLRGENTGPLPDRGTGTGWLTSAVPGTGQSDTYGMGGLSGTGSDAAARDMPKQAEKFTGTQVSDTSPNGRMGRLTGTGSDPAEDTTPGDEGMRGDRD